MKLWLIPLIALVLPHSAVSQSTHSPSSPSPWGRIPRRSSATDSPTDVPATPGLKGPEDEEEVEVVVEGSLETLVPAEARVGARYPPYGDFYDQDAQRRGDYKHKPKKCHPQTITKYKTVYKERKANVYNKVEVRNPKPQVHKTKETRHTTIRYPVFITQVIKPLLTQVETKVKPMFFTKTLKRIKTIVFTVTGIGQVTVTSVKYEKEYVTRCQKKGYGHKGGHGGGHGGGYGHHRRADEEESYDPDYVDSEYAYSPPEATHRLRSYEDLYRHRKAPRSSSRFGRSLTDLAPSFAFGENPDSDYIVAMEV